jgi:hypothetical protein
MLFAVYIFPILSKVARLVLIIVSAIYASKASNLTAVAYDTSGIQVQMIESVYFITAADNAYAPIFVLLSFHILYMADIPRPYFYGNSRFRRSDRKVACDSVMVNEVCD